MPAGMTWIEYIKFAIGAGVCVAIGSQIVHRKYKPLSDLDAYINREILTYTPEEQVKIRTAIQVKKDRIEMEIDALPPEIREKVKQAVLSK